VPETFNGAVDIATIPEDIDEFLEKEGKIYTYRCPVFKVSKIQISKRLAKLHNFVGFCPPASTHVPTRGS